MNAFVDECRREWKRLGVPDSLAEEMASDLEADLEDASAEGVSGPEVLGESDPRRFAANLAVARGLVPDERSGPRRRRTFWLIVSAALVLLVGGLTTLALVSTGTHTSTPPVTTVGPPPQRKTVSLSLVVGLKESRASAILRASGLQFEIVRVPHHRAGVVVAQIPAAGTHVVRGSIVRLQIGRGG
jgi:hypothetical protein